MQLIVITMLVAGAEAHGGLVFPPPRNNYGNVNPTNLTYQPGSKIPRWQGGSCAGDACSILRHGDPESHGGRNLLALAQVKGEILSHFSTGQRDAS